MLQFKPSRDAELKLFWLAVEITVPHCRGCVRMRSEEASEAHISSLPPLSVMMKGQKHLRWRKFKTRELGRAPCLLPLLITGNS